MRCVNEPGVGALLYAGYLYSVRSKAALLLLLLRVSCMCNRPRLGGRCTDQGMGDGEQQCKGRGRTYFMLCHAVPEHKQLLKLYWRSSYWEPLFFFSCYRDVCLCLGA